MWTSRQVQSSADVETAFPVIPVLQKDRVPVETVVPRWCVSSLSFMFSEKTAGDTFFLESRRTFRSLRLDTSLSRTEPAHKVAQFWGTAVLTIQESVMEVRGLTRRVVLCDSDRIQCGSKAWTVREHSDPLASQLWGRLSATHKQPVYWCSSAPVHPFTPVRHRRLTAEASSEFSSAAFTTRDWSSHIFTTVALKNRSTCVQVLGISSDNLLDLLERVLWCWWTRGGPTVQLMKPGSRRQTACTCFHSGWKSAGSSWSSFQTDLSWLSWRPSPHPGQSMSPLAAHPCNSRRKPSRPMDTEPQLP